MSGCQRGTTLPQIHESWLFFAFTPIAELSRLHKFRFARQPGTSRWPGELVGCASLLPHVLQPVACRCRCPACTLHFRDFGLHRMDKTCPATFARPGLPRSEEHT